MTVKAISCGDKTRSWAKNEVDAYLEIPCRWTRRFYAPSSVLRIEFPSDKTDPSWRSHRGSWNASFSVYSIYRFAIFVPSFSNLSSSAPTKSLLRFHKENDSFRKILKRFRSVESTIVLDSVMMLIMIILITRTGTNKSNANNVIITYYGRWMHIQFVWCNNNTVINNNR